MEPNTPSGQDGTDLADVARATAPLHERLAQLPAGASATPADRLERIVLLAQLRAAEVLGPHALTANWWPVEPDHTSVLADVDGQRFLAQLSDDSTAVTLFHVLDCANCRQGLRVHPLQGPADFARLVREDPTGRRSYSCTVCADRPTSHKALQVVPTQEHR